MVSNTRRLFVGGPWHGKVEPVRPSWGDPIKVPIPRPVKWTDCAALPMDLAHEVAIYYRKRLVLGNGRRLEVMAEDYRATPDDVLNAALTALNLA